MTTTTGTEQRMQRPINRPGQPDEHVNVSSPERWFTGALGGSLALQTLRRRSAARLVLGALGGVMLYRAVSGHCPTYSALGINTARRGHARPSDYFHHGIHVESAQTINKPVEELYRFWRNFENLPRFMNHLESVTMRGERESHWVAKAPAGSTVKWDAEIIREEPNNTIAWRSLPGADVDNAGSVRFIPAPGGRGTEVHVTLEYIPPAGKLGSAIARLFGEEPRQQVREDLRHFKQLMETGEIPTTQGQPHGTCGH